MRWMLVLLVVAALGAGAGSSSTTRRRLVPRRGDDEPRGGRSARGPALHGTGAAGARELVGAKGRASLDVDVRLAGRGVVATVEVRRVGGTELADPSRAGQSWYRAIFALPEPDRAPQFLTRSDPQGRARLAELAPGIYRVNARDEAGNEASANTSLPQEGARGAVTLDLEPADAGRWTRGSRGRTASPSRGRCCSRRPSGARGPDLASAAG